MILLILFLLMRSAKADCIRAKDALMVNAKTRQITICENGQVHRNYSASFGRGGFGKVKEGDLKTPLGDYALGVPRGSSRFHTFIPVGYPTAAQRAAGFTGRDVGVHGPFKSIPVPSAFLTLTDWTQGCIAVGSDEEIDEIANWVNQHPKARIIIE